MNRATMASRMNEVITYRFKIPATIEEQSCGKKVAKHACRKRTYTCALHLLLHSSQVKEVRAEELPHIILQPNEPCTPP